MIQKLTPTTDALLRFLPGSQVDQVWEKGRPLPGANPKQIRMDAYGSLIHRDQYGKTQHPNGWRIDHIFPRVLGGPDDISNLRPLHCGTKRAK